MNLQTHTAKTASRQKLPACGFAPRENRLERRASARVWRRQRGKLVSGLCVWKNDDPFGNNAPDENPNGTNGTTPFIYNLRLPGQYYDQETNTYYNYFRDYDPSTGRYVQSDPIGLYGGINTFSYVSGNPLVSIDPMGLLEYFMMELNRRPISQLKCACGESYSAFSGNPPYRNDPNSTSKANIGAAPEGWYYIVERPDGGVGGKIASYINGKHRWFALYRQDGTPGDETVENGVVRREVRLHPKGERGVSLGCVTLDDPDQYDILRKRLLNTKTEKIPGTNIDYFGMILLYRASSGW